MLYYESDVRDTMIILYVICQLVCVIDPWAHTSFVHSILSLKLGVTVAMLLSHEDSVLVLLFFCCERCTQNLTTRLLRSAQTTHNSIG